MNTYQIITTLVLFLALLVFYRYMWLDKSDIKVPRHLTEINDSNGRKWVFLARIDKHRYRFRSPIGQIRILKKHDIYKLHLHLGYDFSEVYTPKQKYEHYSIWRFIEAKELGLNVRRKALKDIEEMENNDQYGRAVNFTNGSFSIKDSKLGRDFWECIGIN